MNLVTRLRVADAWEQWRVPIALCALGATLLAFNIEPVARTAAVVALLAVAPITSVLSLRSSRGARADVAGHRGRARRA